MHHVSLDFSEILPDGGTVLRVVYNTTAIITSKTVTNRQLREKATFTCRSSQAGSWIIYDVDDAGEANEITTIPVVADSLSIYTHNHVMTGAYCTFTPAVAVAGDTLTVRALFGGAGARL